MSFTLSISSNGISFSEADLFLGEEFFYDVSFYDDVSIEDLKIPYYTSLSLPLTNTNKSLFGYDPITTNVSSFPKGDYHFIISYHNSAQTETRGILNVDSIEYNSEQPYMKVSLKDYISLFASNLSDKNIGDVLTSSYHTSDHLFEDFFNSTSNNGEAGVIGQVPDLTRIVNFPYVDLSNDVEKFGYGARQFTEYGSGENRTGFIPTLSVKNYLKQIGNYLSSGSFPVKVKSKLFGINETESVSDFQASKLQAVIPAKLQAKENFNTRTFDLNNRDATAFPNEDFLTNKTLIDRTRIVRTNYFGSNTYYGHYGAPSSNSPIKKYVLEELRNTLVPNVHEYGYVSPHTSFGSELSFANGSRTQTINTLIFELPVVEEDKMVYKIFPNNSDMTFALKLGVYVDGVLTKSIGLEDSSGNELILNATDASTTQSNAIKDSSFVSSGTVGSFFGLTSGSVAYLDDSAYPNYNDSLQWTNIDVQIPQEDILLDVVGDSRYGLNYYLESVDGILDITYVDAYSAQPPSTFPGYTVFYSSSVSNADFGGIKIRKAITRISNFSDLDITFTANRDFSPYYPDDKFNIKDSINNTCDITVVQFLNAVAKRFGCGLFYEYDGSYHVLRIDPIHLLRTSSYSIDYSIDDLKSISISRPLEAIKNLVILNKDDGLYYDEVRYKDLTRGSTTQELNPNGTTDFELKLESSVYYKSLCGEENFLSNENLNRGFVNEYDIGFTNNLFSQYNDFSIRFAYLDQPLYKTEIKVPYIVNEEVVPGLYTTTQRLYRNIFNYTSSDELGKHVFNGRLFNKNTANWDLLAENESGTITDYYNFIKSTEQLKAKEYPSIKFNMVVLVSETNNNSFMFGKGILSYINGQKVLIKEANGTVYNDKVYLSVKGLIE